jgi:hypothetical protein
MQNNIDQLTALQDEDGHFKWGDALLDLTGKSRAEWLSKRPFLVRSSKLWITAAGIVLLMVEDNTEAAALKARGYLTGRLKEKKAAKLIENAFVELKHLVPGLEGKEEQFVSPKSGTPSWRERLAEAAVKSAVRAAVRAAVQAAVRAVFEEMNFE